MPALDSSEWGGGSSCSSVMPSSFITPCIPATPRRAAAVEFDLGQRRKIRFDQAEKNFRLDRMLADCSLDQRVPLLARRRCRHLALDADQDVFVFVAVPV